MANNFITGILAVTAMAFLIGTILGLAASWFTADNQSLGARIDRLLPQTQCAQCGYPGCRPYADAIANNEADINQCPPGGESGVAALAALLGRPVIALDPDFGNVKPPLLAVIRENECIGCTLCIKACPVDAIVGAAKFMHTVIAEQCTGCELCLPPCPVDCIDLITNHSTTLLNG